MKYENCLFFILLFCLPHSLKAQAVQRLPLLSSLPAAEKTYVEAGGNNFEINSVPSVIFFTANKNRAVLKEQIEEITNFTGWDAFSSSFVNMYITDGIVVFENGDKDYVLYNQAKPKTGVVFSDGEHAPQVIYGVRGSYLPQFKNYFKANNRDEFQKTMRQRSAAENIKNTEVYKSDIKRLLTDLNKYATEKINFSPEALQNINCDILKEVVTDDNIFPPQNIGAGVKKIYAEYTEGAWKGRNYLLEYDRPGRLISCRGSLYENTYIQNHDFFYRANGLLNEIHESDIRIDIGSNNTEKTVIKVTDSFTILQIILPDGKDGYYNTDDLSSLYWSEFVYDENYRLKELSDLKGNTVSSDAKYTYDAAGNLLKIERAIGPTGNDSMLFVRQYGYDKMNTLISKTFIRHQTSQGKIYNNHDEYIVTLFEEKKAGKDGLPGVVTEKYYYDKAGRMVQKICTMPENPYTIKYSYTLF